MTFLCPMMLWALALPLLLAVLALLKRHRMGGGWRLLVSPNHARELVVKTPGWRRVLPLLLLLFALICGILAAARPINGYTTTEGLASGRNLLIALDISRSMETQDVKPSRLEEARAAAFELIDALPQDKIGLIVFSGEADLVVPLTYDHTALRDALEQVNRGWAGYGGTNFGIVLKKALQDFERSAPTGTNALVIFSDGEDTVGPSLEVAEEARRHNLLIITVGVGTTIGDSIPDASGENGLYQDAAGKHVISKLDAESLRRFSEATGGDFFTMGSGADLTAFAQQAADKLDRHEESFSGHKVPRDLFAPFAITALLLLAASMLLGTEWRSTRRSLPLVLLLFTAQPLEAAPEAESLRAYEDALRQVEADADKARELFSRALLDEDEDLQAACHYALGNLNARSSFAKLRALYRPEPAEQADEEELSPMPAMASPTPEQLQAVVDELDNGLLPYMDALKLCPEMKEAKQNLRSVEEFIEKLKEEIERLKQQQQQQDDQQPEEQQDDQNQQQDKSQDGEQEKPQDKQQQDKGEGQQNDQQQEGEQPRQPEEQQGDSPQQQPEQPQEGSTPPPPAEPQPAEAEQTPMSEQEKAHQRAAGILRMHVDEEQGSPIPRPNTAVRPPEKDY